MYLLLSLTAGLVGCFYINRIDKLSESAGGQLRKFAVSFILWIESPFSDATGCKSAINSSLEIFL